MKKKYVVEISDEAQYLQEIIVSKKTGRASMWTHSVEHLMPYTEPEHEDARRAAIEAICREAYEKGYEDGKSGKAMFAIGDEVEITQEANRIGVGGAGKRGVVRRVYDDNRGAWVFGRDFDNYFGNKMMRRTGRNFADITFGEIIKILAEDA